jgi:hypothetical protein
MATAPRKRWYQWTLRTLLFVTLFIGAVLGPIARERWRCARGQALVAEIAKYGYLHFDEPEPSLTRRHAARPQ